MKQFLTYIGMISLVLLTSCVDEFDAGQSLLMSEAPVSRVNDEDNTGLILQTDGTWKANKRVPLTGVGRTIGNMSPGLVSVLGGQGALGSIVDNDIENKASLAGLATANVAYTQIISVKDMYRTYSGGQQAGFVYEVKDTKLLTVDVLKLFTITLYNDGELLQTFNVSEEANTLGLSLLNVSTAGGNAQQTVAIEVPDDMEFDEIAIGYGGVDISALSSMNIYYAFVGETPIRTTVNNSQFDSNPYNASFYEDVLWTNWSGREDMLDSNPDNGPVIELIGGVFNILGGGYKVTINFGETVPAGSEVGFVYTAGDVLNLGLGSTVSMSTYDADPEDKWGRDDVPLETYTVGNVLGASAIGGGKGAYSFITTKDFQHIFLRIIGLNVKLGTTQYHYAYTRAKTEVDATSYFNLPEEVTITTSGYQIIQPEQGSLTVTVIAQPPGAEAKWLADKGRLSGMTEIGKYVFKFEYSTPDGKQTFTQTMTIHREIPTSENDCNTLITKDANDATLADEGDWGICVICGKAQNPDDLLDGSVNTCMTYYGALELLMNQNIVTVKNIKDLHVDETNGYRAGFILQVSKELLSLNALNYLYVDLYKDGAKLEREVSGTRPTVDLGLINGDQGKVRIGVTMPPGTGAFDEIRLYNAGVLGLNFNTIRLYGVFYESAESECASNGIAEACMEMVTPASYGACINYDQTKYKTLVGVANGMYSLDNVLDEDKESAVTIATTNVIGETSLAVKFNEMPAGQWIGAMIRNVGGVADVKLLDALTFEVYHQGTLVADYTNNSDLLNLSLIGYNDKVFLELQPNQPFDEVRISGKSVANVLEQLVVYGIYTRVDADGDGIPDCGEEDGGKDETEDLYPSISTLRLCEQDLNDNKLQIPVWGGRKGKEYWFQIRKYTDESYENEIKRWNIQKTYTDADFDNGYICFDLKGDLQKNDPITGVYQIDFYKLNSQPNEGGTGVVGGDETAFNGLPVYIHPEKTTWTGKINTTWNCWTNWSNGTPWGCTDVVIPAGLSRYPVLGDGANNCARIQFAAEKAGEVGEVVNTQYLTYDEAWVDYRLTGGQYYLLSAPLKAVYTGDVFGNAIFDFSNGVVGTDGNYGYARAWYDGKPSLTDFRITPRVYQRTFGGFINNQTGSGTEVLKPGSDNWTTPFNLVAEEYAAGKSYLVQMDNQSGQTYELRWPIRYDSYEYYYEKDDGTVTMVPERTEKVSRAYAGRFIHENEKGVTKFPLQVILENERPGDAYLTGNPFMAHINLRKFFEVNVGVGEVWLLRNQSAYGESNYEKVARVSVSEEDRIKPIEGFLVKLRSPYSETYRYRYYVNFTEDMLEDCNGNPKEPAGSDSGTGDGQE